MNTAINEVLTTDINMLSIGSIGSTDGTGFTPLYAGENEFQIGHWWGSAAASAIAPATITMSSVNNYFAMPFILNNTTTVNRLAMYVALSGSPNMTIRGGIMQYDLSTGFVTQNSSTGVITFVAGASTTLTDAGTATNFVAGQYTVFAFTSNVTLNANTWYAAGYTVSSYTSGAVTTYTFQNNSQFASQYWPCNSSRIGAGANTTSPGKGGVAVGFFDGTSYNYPIGEYYSAGNSININSTPTTLTQVGTKFEINVPQDELYLSKILLGQAAIGTSNTWANVVCKIYKDITATSAIATSIAISSVSNKTVGLQARNYFFSPPVRLKSYRSYYFMWEVTNGIATTVNPTQINRMLTGVSTSMQYFYNDSNNLVHYRNNANDVNLSTSNGNALPIVLYFDYFKQTNPPRIF
jgi:hypothetical protein